MIRKSVLNWKTCCAIAAAVVIANIATLATRAVACFPQLRGFIGVDAVLGDAGDGSADRAIEINARLTTSYIGLRVLARDNLVAAMLDVAATREPVLRWYDAKVRFDASGRVWSEP